MRRTLSIAAATGIVFWTMVSWADDVIAPLLGNTFTVLEAGETIVLKFNEDGTYTRNDVPGTWEINEAQICMTADGGSESHCEPLEEGHQAGDTWDQVNADGVTVTLSITEGQ